MHAEEQICYLLQAALVHTVGAPAVAPQLQYEMTHCWRDSSKVVFSAGMQGEEDSVAREHGQGEAELQPDHSSDS